MNRLTLLLLLIMMTSAVNADDGYVTVDPVYGQEESDSMQQDPPVAPQSGTPVYKESDCIGAVVNGVCHGTIQSTDPMPQRCYGQMINGKCTGPQF
jgi:hypothetical protein